MKRAFLGFVTALAVCTNAASTEWETRGPEGVSAYGIVYDDRGTELRLVMSGARNLWETSLATPSWSPLLSTDTLGSPAHLRLDPAWGGYLFNSETNLVRYISGADSQSLAVGDYFREFAVSADGSVIYVATYNDGMAYSTDGGANFSLSPSSIPESTAIQVVIHPADTSTAYAVFPYGNGIFRTLDGGLTWSAYDVGAAHPLGLAFDPTNSSVMTVSALGGVWRSVDGGTSWSQTSTMSGSNVTYARDGSLLIMESVLKDGVYVSRDGGTTWDLMSLGHDDLVVTDIAVHPTDAEEFALSSTMGVLRTTNAGANWVVVDEGIRKIDATALARSGSGRLVLNTIGHGVYVSANDGQSWTSVDSGPLGPANNGYASAIDPANDNIMLASNLTSIARSTDGGVTWTAVHSAYALDFTFTDTPGEVFAATQTGILYSTDAGDTWEYRNGNLASAPYVEAIATMPGDSPRWFAATHDGLLISEDAGATWTSTLGGQATAIAVSQSDPGIVYVATTSALHRSADGGATWQSLDTSTLGIRVLALHPDDADVVFAGTGDNYLMLSIDGGASWHPMSDTDFGIVEDIIIESGDSYALWVASQHESVNRALLAWSDVEIDFEPNISTASDTTTASFSVTAGTGLGAKDIEITLDPSDGMTIGNISAPSGMDCALSNNVITCAVSALATGSTLQLSIVASSGTDETYTIGVTATSDTAGAVSVANGGRMLLTFDKPIGDSNDGGGSGGGGGTASGLLLALLAAAGLIAHRRRSTPL